MPAAAFVTALKGLTRKHSELPLGKVKKLGFSQLHDGEVDLSVGLVFGQG